MGKQVMNKGYVYFLIDPRDWQVKYVGSTNNPDNRLRQHIDPNTKSAGKALTKWIEELATLKLIPVMTIVEECLLSERKDRENFWIQEVLYIPRLHGKEIRLLNENILTAYMRPREGMIANAGCAEVD